MKIPFFTLLLALSFTSLTYAQDSTQQFEGIDSKTGETCNLTLSEGNYAEVSYIDETYFFLRRFRAGAPTGGCDSKYHHCLFGPPINDDTGDIDDDIEYDLFVAFDSEDQPLYFMLENITSYSPHDKTCLLK